MLGERIAQAAEKRKAQGSFSSTNEQCGPVFACPLEPPVRFPRVIGEKAPDILFLFCRWSAFVINEEKYEHKNYKKYFFHALPIKHKIYFTRQRERGFRLFFS